MPPKNKKKAAPSDAAGGDGGPPAKLNKTDSDFSAIDFGNDCKTESGDKWDFKISSWNVDGMRAWAKKGNYTYLLVSISSHRCSLFGVIPGRVTYINGFDPVPWNVLFVE